MITLTVIAVDRYFVITRPLTSIGVLSRKRALLILAAAWTYSLGWSLPPFFGWSEVTHTHTHTRSGVGNRRVSMVTQDLKHHSEHAVPCLTT